MTPGNGWERRAADILVQRREQRFREDWQNRLLAAIKPLVEKKHCAREAMFWLSSDSLGQRRRRIAWSTRADGRDAASHPALTLNGLQRLGDGALLTLEIILERDGTLVSYSVGLQGRLKRRADCWYARIDLDEQQKGQGPCGHPMLHCHVGMDPADKEDARAALPLLTPVEALEWVLATVDPALEPT